MSKPGTVSGAIEHKYGGRRSIAVNRCLARLLTQEAMIRRDFGEEGVARFWEEVNRRDEDVDEAVREK